MTLLFFKSCDQEAQYIKSTLEVYANATRQLLNPAKCSMMVGSSCPDVTRDGVKHILQVITTGFEEKYLGLPDEDM